ncbi:VOC family protein [Croceitalea rosinachiae]|uniref:VOC family protein n=1 Tax=Croceitalea rosinachiae TaxID=3075596 RepID=A0ABU3A809_9FLAO|nr:VOC family protein [Croceitalea sp. F388]MDT0606015.1 VOC family protein [Croceitalea sp. F388]
MKKLFITLFISFLSLQGYAQAVKLSDPEAYFSALIVENIENSITWYTNNIGFEILNKKEYPEAGFKQANLKRGNVLIELIELNSAISPKDAIANYNSKTRITGFFKIGFLISDFDKWISHLTTQRVEFHGTIVNQQESHKRMAIIKDPDGNRIQFFEK